MVYQRISLPNNTKNGISGCPELPIIIKLIAVPECSGVTLSYNVTSTLSMENYNVYPAPDLLEELVDDNIMVTEVFNKNMDIYSTNSMYPQEIVQLGSTGYFRNQKYVQILYYPFQYNPVTGELRINKTCNIQISVNGATSEVNRPTGLFNNVASNVFLNYYGDGKTASNTNRSNTNSSVSWISLTNANQLDNIAADYIIITDPQFFEPNNPDNQLRRLALHRATNNGYNVAILNVSDILSDAVGILPLSSSEPDYWREQKIRNCIKRVFENGLAPNTYDGHIAYVLLAGDALYNIYPQHNTSYGVPSSHDATVIPYSSFNSNYPSDHYYALLTKFDDISFDQLPDIFIGRLPVNNSTELSNMVNKTIKYETEFPIVGYRNKLLFSNSLFNNLGQLYIKGEHGVYSDLLPEIITEPYTYSIVDAEIVGSCEAKSIVKDKINEGVFFFDYYGHSHVSYLDLCVSSYQGPLSISYLENNLTNDNMNPFLYAYSCDAGSFNHCEYDEECFAESLVRYSDSRGFVASLASSAKAVLYSNSTPPNGIWPFGVFDASLYYIFQHSSSVAGEFIQEAKIFGQTSIQLPYPNYANASLYYTNYFGDPALNLMAQGYQITHNTTFSGDIAISNSVFVRPGVTLTINGNVYFETNGRLIIDEGAMIEFNNCNFYGKEIFNAVEINGTVINNTTTERPIVSFEAPVGKTFGGLVLNNPAINIVFQKLILKRSPIFGNKLSSFTIESYSNNKSLIENSPLYFQGGNCDLRYTDFTLGSTASFRNYSGMKTTTLKMKYCNFSGINSEACIYIGDYSSFEIDYNTFNFERFDAINLFNSGSVAGRKHTILGNSINFVGSEYNNNNGIKVYHSVVNIENNSIKNASYGISCLNNSNISLLGNCESTQASTTQQFVNNRINQVFATPRSFPYSFRFNFIDNTLNSNPLVYYNTPVDPMNPYLNIRCNKWGEPFTPSSDLFPPGSYFYLPEWNFNGCNCSSNEAKEIFESALQSTEDEDYISAESGFKEIVENYPSSEYAPAAVTELLALKKNDDFGFGELKIYLDNNIPINDTTELGARSAFVKNWCDIEAKNFSDAIAWFENRLSNPESLSDSVFAMIDLNYTLFLMGQDSFKYSPEFKFPEIIAKDRVDFQNKKRGWIDLLYQKNTSVQFSGFGYNEIHSISVAPNPSSESIVVSFTSTFENTFLATIYINDEVGRMVEIKKGVTVNKGHNTLKLKIQGYRPGVYFVNILDNNGLNKSCKFIKSVK